MSNEISIKVDPEYLVLIDKIKNSLLKAQLRAARAANTEAICFYRQLGEEILIIQSVKSHWGTGLLEQLSIDLQAINPGMTGFSKRSLAYMRDLAILYPHEQEFLQQPAAKLPWSHIQLLLDKFRKDTLHLDWYAKETIQNGWSRSTLNSHIKSQLFERQALGSHKVSNYLQILPSPQSDLAHDMLKDPYNFDFLTISKEAHERDIEKSLMNHIREFLLELGSGFSFVGTQVPLEIDGEQFFIDVLFYHLKLRAYVVIEIKAKRFKPADLGQLSFYLSAVDSQLRHEHDQPTIGILLCESRSKIIAEYALRNINAPIGVSEYILEKNLPKELKTSLPTIAQLEAELNDFVSEDAKLEENKDT